MKLQIVLNTNQRCKPCFQKFLLAFLLVFCASIYAQNTSLVPKDVYVGDEAEIRFSFAWEGNIFAADKEQSASSLNTADFDESLDNAYTVKSMHIKPSANGYVLSIIFIPWQVGFLDIPPFDLSMTFDIARKPLLIDIPEVYIQSIVEKTGEKNIRPPTGPVIIPGTTYVVLGIIVAIFTVCVLILILLLRLTPVTVAIKNFFRQIWATQNFRKTTRALIRLEKQSAILPSDAFAAKLSVIIRCYLEGRFIHPFTAETTSSLMTVFNRLFAGTASNKTEDFMQNLYEVCARCDFLRYAGPEIKHAPLSTEERLSLIEKSRLAFIHFEKNDGNDDEGGAV